MKLNIAQIVNAQNSLSKVLNCELDTEKAFDLAVFIKETEKHFFAYETVRINKIAEFGEKNKDGNTGVKEENFDKFDAEIKKITSKEVEVPDLKLTREEITGGKLMARDILILDFIIDLGIKEEEQEEAEAVEEVKVEKAEEAKPVKKAKKSKKTKKK